MSKVDLLASNRAPYRVIIRHPALEEIKTGIDLGQEHVEVSVNNRKARIGLEIYIALREEESSTDRDKEPFEPDSGFHLRMKTKRILSERSGMSSTPSYAIFKWKGQTRSRPLSAMVESPPGAFLIFALQTSG